MPKFDHLNLVVSLYHPPPIICIVETWLCKDILDDELLISGYQLFRFDRNCHGGGVLMYVENCSTVCLDPIPPSPLELMSICVNVDSVPLHVCLFYCPPSLDMVYLIVNALIFCLLMKFTFLIFYVLEILILTLTMLLILCILICLIFPLCFVCHKQLMALLTPQRLCVDH